MSEQKSLAVKVGRAVLARVVLPLVVLMIYPSLLYPSFRISRPYPLPPAFENYGYIFPAVAYGGGVYLVYYSLAYVDTGTTFPVWSQCMVSRVSPTGQVLDSIPISITLKTAGWRELANYASASPPAFDGSDYFLLWATGSLTVQDTSVIWACASAPMAPLWIPPGSLS